MQTRRESSSSSADSAHFNYIFIIWIWLSAPHSAGFAITIRFTLVEWHESTVEDVGVSHPMMAADTGWGRSTLEIHRYADWLMTRDVCVCFLPCSPRSTLHGHTEPPPSRCNYWHCSNHWCIPVSHTHTHTSQVSKGNSLMLHKPTPSVSPPHPTSFSNMLLFDNGFQIVEKSFEVFDHFHIHLLQTI